MVCCDQPMPPRSFSLQVKLQGVFAKEDGEDAVIESEL